MIHLQTLSAVETFRESLMRQLQERVKMSRKCGDLFVAGAYEEAIKIVQQSPIYFDEKQEGKPNG